MHVVLIILSLLLVISDTDDLMKGKRTNILISCSILVLLMWEINKYAGGAMAFMSIAFLLYLIIKRNS